MAQLSTQNGIKMAIKWQQIGHKKATKWQQICRSQINLELLQKITLRLSKMPEKDAKDSTSKAEI